MSIRRWTIVLCLLACAWSAAHADVTVWVQASSAPKLYVFEPNGTCTGTNSGTAYSSYTTWSGAQMSKNVTTSDGKTWYYEVFTGLNSASIIFNNGTDQTDNITGVSGTKYYYYNGQSAYIDLTSLKGSLATNYCFFQNNSGFTTRYVYTFSDNTEGDCQVSLSQPRLATIAMVIFTTFH